MRRRDHRKPWLSVGLERVEMAEDGAKGCLYALYVIEATLHYEGKKGAERMVRVVSRSGCATHYEGEKGAERLVRVEEPPVPREHLILEAEHADGDEAVGVDHRFLGGDCVDSDGEGR